MRLWVWVAASAYQWGGYALHETDDTFADGTSLRDETGDPFASSSSSRFETAVTTAGEK